MSLELIIFDLDGTIVDTCDDITKAINYCLGKYEIQEFTKNEVKSLIGEGVRKFIEKVLEIRNLSKEFLFPLLNCFISYYSAHIADLSKPYPGVIETLQKLNGIKKAIISNKLTELTMKTLDATGLKKYFDFIAGNDYFAEQKPSALPILKTMEYFKAMKERTIMVGDSNIDIEAGKAAGIKTVAVTYGYRQKELLRNADFIIDKFEDLLKVIKEIK